VRRWAGAGGLRVSFTRGSGKLRGGKAHVLQVAVDDAGVVAVSNRREDLSD
jgi:hypothetical protein